MGSMLTATIFGVFFTPLFYVATRKWLGRRSPAGAAPKEAP
jgi:multidrug efflux pump